MTRSAPAWTAKPLPKFAFKDFGSLVSLGHLSAVGSLMGGLIGGSMFIEGLMARFMYTSLYRMHVLALHGAIAHGARYGDALAAQQDQPAREAALRSILRRRGAAWHGAAECA